MGITVLQLELMVMIVGDRENIDVEDAGDISSETTGNESAASPTFPAAKPNQDPILSKFETDSFFNTNVMRENMDNILLDNRKDSMERT